MTNAPPPAWIRPARVSWLLLSLACVSLFVVGVLTTLSEAPPSCTTPGANCSPAVISQEDVRAAEALRLPVPLMALSLGAAAVARLSLAVVAVVIFWRRSDDWVALMTSGALMSVLLEGGYGHMGLLTAAVAALFVVGTVLFIPIPFVFPNGRIEPRWLRPVVAPLTVVYGLSAPLFYLWPEWSGPNAVINLVWTVLAVYAMGYRYFRVATAVERQQIKWVLVGMAAALTVGLVFTTISLVWPVSQPSSARTMALLVNAVVYVIGYGFFALSFLMAMLRYRLWDIDLIIRRTLQWSAVSGLLALMYFGLITVLQGLFRSISNQQSEISIVLSTLTIAALFGPVRGRVQRFIDLRFFRPRYDAERVLAEFAAHARDETDLNALTGKLAGVVQETMQPESVTIWLKPR